MVNNSKRVVMWSGIILASAVMLVIGIYKGFVLLLGSLFNGIGPASGFYLAFLIEPPAYLVSAATAWKWPWIAETVAALNLVIIFMRFHPWTVSPFQRGLSLEYAFIIAANVAFFAKISLGGGPPYPS